MKLSLLLASLAVALAACGKKPEAVPAVPTAPAVVEAPAPMAAPAADAAPSAAPADAAASAAVTEATPAASK